MPGDPNNFNSSSLPAGLGDGSVNLSQSSISALSNSLSLSVSGALKSILPAFISSISSALSYSAGVNQYTRQQFMAPMMGTSAFSAHQANQAYSMGVVNKNAYLTNYANALGFQGMPTQLSNYMARLPGGMDMMNAGIERAMAITQRETGLNPMIAEQQMRRRRADQVYNTAATNFISKANSSNLLDGAGNFTNVRQIKEAIERYGNILDPNNDNERWKKLTPEQRELIKQMSSRISELDGIRSGDVNKDGVSLVDIELENQIMDKNRGVREARKREREVLMKRRAKEGTVTEGMSPEERKRAEEAAKELDRRIAEKDAQIDLENLGGEAQMTENSRNFLSMDREARMFRMATVADMAVSNAMVFDEQAGMDAVAAGKMTLGELNAKQSAKQFVLKAGGEENARMIAAEFSRVLTDPDNFMPGGSVEQTIRAGMKSLDANVTDEQIQGRMAYITGLLGSSKSEDQIRGMQELMALSSAAGAEGDVTGMAGVIDMYGKATALAGGDQKAAQDMVAAAMAMNGKTDITKLSKEDIESSNELVSRGAMLGVDALATTLDSVTSSLNNLGIATRDVTGKQTRLAGVLAKSSIDMQLNLVKNGGVDKQTAQFIADESMQDLVGSRSGQGMLETLGYLGTVHNVGKEELQQLSETLSNMTPEEQAKYLREKGGIYAEAVDYRSRASSGDRAKMLEYAIDNDLATKTTRENLRRNANLETLNVDVLRSRGDEAAAQMLEHAEFNESRFNSKEFKNLAQQLLGVDVDKLDTYDEQTQKTVRQLSGLSDDQLAQFARTNDMFAQNNGISRTDTNEEVLKKLTGAGAMFTTSVELPDDTRGGTAALAGEPDENNGLGESRAANVKAIDDAMSDLSAAVKNTEAFMKKVSDAGDAVMGALGDDGLAGAAVETAKALQKVVDVVGSSALQQ